MIKISKEIQDDLDKWLLKTYKEFKIKILPISKISSVSYVLGALTIDYINNADELGFFRKIIGLFLIIYFFYMVFRAIIDLGEYFGVEFDG